MSNRTWACVQCRKSYRRVQTISSVACPECHQSCEQVEWKMRIPSPDNHKEWGEFWSAYRAEKALEAAYLQGELHESVYLPLLNRHLAVS